MSVVNAMLFVNDFLTSSFTLVYFSGSSRLDIVHLLGGSYLASNACVYCRNPLSSTMDTGCKSVVIIFTSASSRCLYRIESLGYFEREKLPHED